MSSTLNEVVVHIDEALDPTALLDLESGIRNDLGVVSVGLHPARNHLMVVVYDCAVARASSILHNFRERGLHAQLVGM